MMPSNPFGRNFLLHLSLPLTPISLSLHSPLFWPLVLHVPYFLREDGTTDFLNSNIAAICFIENFLDTRDFYRSDLGENEADE